MAAATDALGLYYNQVVVCGTVSKYGVTTRFLESGVQQVSFSLELKELDSDEKVHTLFLDIAAWGARG